MELHGANAAQEDALLLITDIDLSKQILTGILQKLSEMNILLRPTHKIYKTSICHRKSLHRSVLDDTLLNISSHRSHVSQLLFFWKITFTRLKGL